MYNTLVDAVFAHSQKHPNKLAIADQKQVYHYGELMQAVMKTGAWFASIGLHAGDRVLIECTQDATYLVLCLSCQWMGLTFVPVEKRATLDRVQSMYEEAKANCLIADSIYEGCDPVYTTQTVMSESRQHTPWTDHEVSSTDVAEILFTTGTTGKPKGIVMSHGANVAIAENISVGVEMKETSVELIPLPLSHSHGLRTCYAHFFRGSSVVITDGVMNVGALFSLMDTHAVNAFDFSPTVAKLLLKIAKQGLIKCADHIDYIEIGTAMLEDDTKAQLKTLFPSARLYNFYGSTEAGRSCVLDFNQFDETGCVGFPACNAQFFFVDDARQVIKSAKDQLGLVAVSGKMMMDEYLDSPKLTSETLVDGLLYTNDLGYMDEDGHVFIVGRKDDIINYKGIKIAPEEIESVANGYAQVQDCACVPVQDALCGQKPKLFVSVQSSDAFDLADFQQYLKANLEQSRVPAMVEVIEVIPRSSNGKLQRKKLME